MDINFMVLATPMFLVLIGLECLISYYKKKSLYHLNDSVNNFCSGILEETGALPFKGLIIYSYYYLYEHYAFFNINTHSVLSWFLLWIGVDFFYYWFHRVSHRNNFFWVGHSVHHQSEHYNLSVALRQGFFQTLTSWVFYLPLALIGFPTWMFAVVASINTIYQFWIHTQTINKMGWFEKIFNTPSHHRVHHGRNPQYIDKNYAGSLIIWDKLFGTFEPEGAPVEYGVTEPLDSWNPFYANIKVIKDLLYYGKNLNNKFNLLRAFFMPPEWIIKQLEQEHSVAVKRPHLPLNTKSPVLYMLLNTTVAVILFTYLSLTYDPYTVNSWVIGAIVMLTLLILGIVANGKRAFQWLEIIRAVLVSMSLSLTTNNLILPLSIGLVFFVINHLLCHYPWFRTSAYWARTQKPL
ncbi:sterol desaturase family protein [Legionella bononiensis]|uniref:Sterol desaturase family protein n=1 Tax=Legionella bononiensis TaxID=2793102 RepID=A0ABS1WAB5_9GAMM|nr:sterol desaturase family protein [Legionella bononiensis]MBL7526293.1 sterol desaturase family protein [Legionella bononiensis]MBL7563212.1 sterol desaturase family protein [Legionella bononiensis]